MAIVAEYSWESDTWTQHHNEVPDRAAFRAAVAEITTKAHEKLPECNSRIDKAVALVLAGDVELLPDGTAKVASQSNGHTQYVVCNGHCTCKGYQKAPHNFCKHRLGSAIMRRAQELIKARLAQLDAASNGQAASDPAPAQPSAPTAPLPEAAGETPQGIPPQHVVLIQGKPFVKFAGLLQMAHERGLVALTADWTYNDAELSLAHVAATGGIKRRCRGAVARTAFPLVPLYPLEGKAGKGVHQACSRPRRLKREQVVHLLCFPCPRRFFCLHSAHMYSIVDGTSCHLHHLDVIRRVHPWLLLLPPTHHAIRAVRCSIK